MKDLRYYRELKKFNDEQIWEVYYGLKNGVDVSVYANPEYHWRQMRQIRLGLESEVDVSVYANPELDGSQTEKIKTELFKLNDNNKVLMQNPNAFYENLLFLDKRFNDIFAALDIKKGEYFNEEDLTRLIESKIAELRGDISGWF